MIVSTGYAELHVLDLPSDTKVRPGDKIVFVHDSGTITKPHTVDVGGRPADWVGKTLDEIAPATWVNVYLVERGPEPKPSFRSGTTPAGIEWTEDPDYVAQKGDWISISPPQDNIVPNLMGGGVYEVNEATGDRLSNWYGENGQPARAYKFGRLHR